MNTLQIGDVWLHDKEGGLGRYFFELLRHLPATHTCRHSLVIGSGEVARATHGSVIGFAQAGEPLLRRMAKARAAALAQMRADTVDLVAAHFAPYLLPILDRASSLPLVMHFHGPWAQESGTESGGGLGMRAKAAIERLVYSRAARLIVLSQHFRQELVARYRIDERRIRVVPGGIDLARFHTGATRAEARALLGWPQHRPIVLAVRRQVRRMGLEELIDTAALLARRQPEALVLLGGTGPIAAELGQRIDALGLSRSVRLLGRIDDALLPLAYRAADLTVVPSRALEGFGLITLESLACGTPVFVTRVGGLPEIVEPFAPQCIFPDGSAETMAATLADAFAGRLPLPTETDCRAYVERHFSWTAIARQVSAVYDEAVA